MRSSKLNNNIQLRNVVDEDLAIFFDYQLDEQANYMAAFIARDPTDRDAFDKHWRKIRSDETVIIKTITVDKEVVGHVASFVQDEKLEITYWIGNRYWGKGIATNALCVFLQIIKERPIYAWAAKDNTASLRVLEKCGFKITGEDKNYAKARGEEVEEYILILD